MEKAPRPISSPILNSSEIAGYTSQTWAMEKFLLGSFVDEQFPIYFLYKVT